MSYNYKNISNNPQERQRIIYPYCYWENSFTNDELDKICEILSSSELTDACVAANNLELEIINPIPTLDEVRKSKVSFHTLKDENKWIFDRLNSVIELVNNRWFNFDINGYDQLQYTEYHSSNLGCYGWHTDLFYGPPPTDSYSETRKLSLTLLLNEPGIDFEGGELQFGHEKNSESVNAKKGTIIIFPSFELHQVSPVTKGVRKSLVVWVLGPKWK